MRQIALTSPTPIVGEVSIITQSLRSGELWRVHLRRPTWSIYDTRRWLECLPPELLPLISLHDHHELALEYPIGGIHLNTRHPHPLPDFSGLISRSCHSLAEIEKYKPSCAYLFLSPIFDSISKHGYRSGFMLHELREACLKGVINEQVFALGGVSVDKYHTLEALHFGGAALLGAFWQ